MAQGEKSFGTDDVKKVKRSFKAIPVGDYDLKLLGKQAEIRTAEPRMNDKTKKMSQPKPRVSCRFEAIGTGEDGGRNSLVFHDLYTDMTPDKGGTVSPAGADQLKGLADAIGDAANIPFAMYLPKGSSEKVKVLDARALLKWIQDHDGQVVRAHVGVQAGTKDYPASKNKIEEFLEQTDGAGESDDDEIPDADDEALEELPDMDEDEEKPSKKVASKKKR